ncbi:MAG: class I SAM-dependent methyltransferase [Betaproteobacteria bacterium]
MSTHRPAVPDAQHKLGVLTSSLVYLRCLLANLFHKLVIGRVRSRGQVTSDYDQGEWLGTLREARWERCKDLADYVFTNDTQPIDAIVDGRLTRLPRRDYYRYRTQKLVATLQRHAGDTETLVEIGSGAGRNLVALAYAGPWQSLLGLELSQTGREVTRKVCDRFGIGSVQAVHVDLLDPGSEGFDKLRGAVVFSFYCLEQLPAYTRRVMDNLCRAGVKRVIHIEPTTELFSAGSLKDLATISYIWRQDYQRTLVSTAQAMQAEGTVRLLACERLHFAPSCRNDPTLVVWEPVNATDRP